MLFDGLIGEGFPAFGILYKLPRIYIGRLSVRNKSNYKFSYKKTDLFLKSMRYSVMLQSFSLEGEIQNFAPDVKYISGYFPHHKPLLEGIYYLRSRDGKVYIGSMKESTRHGFGLMLLQNGHSMIGHWSKGRFDGIYRCPPFMPDKNPHGNSHLQGAGDSAEPRRTLSKKSLKSVSHYESVKRVFSFNKVPVEVRGNFSIVGDSLILSDYGRILFLDGSVYQGEISSNRMSGFGTMYYSTGESYEGQWRHNQPNGIGRLNGINYVFEGQFKNGVWQGFGILTLPSEKKRVKGEFEKGRLRFALIDDIEPSIGMLQIDRMHVSVTEESNLFRTGKIELTGVCHVLFMDRTTTSTHKLPGSKATRDLHDDHGAESAAVTEKQMYESEGVKTPVDGGSASKSNLINPRTSVISRASNKPYQFVGVFRKNEWSDLEGFAQNQVIGLGYLIKGTDVVFKGITSYEFDRFFGVKYDHETETEFKGSFNGHLRLMGIGESSRGDVQYFGTFKKNQKNGLIKKIKAGQEAFIAEYEDDKKNGFFLKFQPDSQLLTEYSMNKLRRIYYNQI